MPGIGTPAPERNEYTALVCPINGRPVDGHVVWSGRDELRVPLRRLLSLAMLPRRLIVQLVVCCVALAAVPVVPRYLPLVDFPQHVAQMAIWNHIGDPTFHLGDRFRINLATPYALPNLAAHEAAQVLGPEGGLRFLLAAALVAFPLAALFLMRTFGRPPELAIAAVPASLSFAYSYGFVPYVISLPLVLCGIALSRRYSATGRPRDAALLATISLVTIATHGFAFMVLCLVAAVTALATTRSLARLAVVAATLAPGFVWSLGWVVLSSADPNWQALPTAYGSWRERLHYLLASVYGEDTRDPRVIAVAVAFVVVAVVARRWSRPPASSAGDDSGRRALGVVALVAFAAAALCPQTLMNTWGLWERIPPVAFVALAGAIRWPDAEQARARLAAGLTGIALFASGASVWEGIAFSRQAAGIRELAQELPKGQRVMWTACGDERPSRFSFPSFKHLGAYVLADRGGDLSYTFSHFRHMVVRYRGNPLPPDFDPSAYDVVVMRLGPRCPSPEALRSMGPIAAEGPYVALRANAVTPELAATLRPEWELRLTEKQ